MAVDEGIKTGGVCNDFFARPGRRGRVNAQMTQTDNVICAHLTCLVDGLLDCVVELPAVVTAQNIVNITGLACVHEVSRGGLGKAFGGRHTNKSDPFALDAEHLVSRQNAQVGAHIDPVAGNIREVCLFDDSLCACHAIVELMVAGRCQIVASLVHQLDDGCAVIH